MCSILCFYSTQTTGENHDKARFFLPAFSFNPDTETVKLDLPENTHPGTVLAILSMPEADFLDIAIGGSDWLDFDVTENDDGTFAQLCRYTNT